MIRVGGHRVSGTTKRLWRIAILAAAGALGTTSAEAAFFEWSDSYPGYYRPAPIAPPRPTVRRLQAKKPAPQREAAKPQGPLIVAISIEKQKLKIYDANGLFAEAPVSTGMKGHPTPMGVFSVIQKQKWHQSNIYSGAPMPYMQRITWSGIAIHAGVLPGYPASHGCIRMPMAFAVKMWNWTRMGARVIVTPGEMTPASFSHPLLATQRVVPQPVAANEPPADAPLAAKSDKASVADVANKPAIPQASLELRSTLGHNEGVKPAIGELPATAPLREQTHTADASGDVVAATTAVTMYDAPSGALSPPREAAPAATEPAPSVEVNNASSVETRSGPATSEAEPASGKRDGIASPDEKPAETKSDEVTAEVKSGESKKPDDVNAAPQKADATKSSEKPDQGIKPGAGVSASVPDTKKDQDSLPGTAKPADAKPDPAALATPKRTGQIAVFASRKDSKLYVRQNFSPLFEVPITIAPSDRPLGTHVFTAQVDKDNVLHWSVISLPAPARYAARRDEDEHAARRRKMAGAVEMKPTAVPDSPTEALDRLSIPADAMARINEALSTGSSIIVSDQGIAAGETGEGTDFIVSLR